MIIKCPSCNSEFAVDDEIIRKAKSPTFHCNICNLFFRVAKEDLVAQSSEINKGLREPEEWQTTSHDDYFTNEESFAKQAFDTIKPLLRIGKSSIFNIGKIKNKQSQNLFEAQEDLGEEFGAVENGAGGEAESKAKGEGREELREEIEEAKLASQKEKAENQNKINHKPLHDEVEEITQNSTTDDIAAAVSALAASGKTENISESKIAVESENENNENQAQQTANIWKWDSQNKTASSEIHGKKVKQYIDDINFNSNEESVFIDDYISEDKNKIFIKETVADFKRHFASSAGGLKNGTSKFTKNTAKIANNLLILGFKFGKSAGSAIKHIPLKIVLFLLIPYVVFASICYGALNLNSAPKLIATIIDINKKNLPEVAPTSLEILNIEQKEIETSDNKKIINISCEIFNTDIYSFQNINLELATYDKHNRLIKSKFVSLNNKLATEFLEEAENNPNIRFEALLSVLSLDDIITRQNSISSKTNIKLRPNYRTTFNFALTDITDKIAYFSVKVYSVKKTVDNS